MRMNRGKIRYTETRFWMRRIAHGKIWINDWLRPASSADIMRRTMPFDCKREGGRPMLRRGDSGRGQDRHAEWLRANDPLCNA
jgi:hypothetical protein